MSARHKLNVAFVNGSVMLAAAAGAATGSWVVFGLTAAALLGANLYSGEVRLAPRRPERRQPPDSGE